MLASMHSVHGCVAWNLLLQWEVLQFLLVISLRPGLLMIKFLNYTNSCILIEAMVPKFLVYTFCLPVPKGAASGGHAGTRLDSAYFPTDARSHDFAPEKSWKCVRLGEARWDETWGSNSKSPSSSALVAKHSSCSKISSSTGDPIPNDSKCNSVKNLQCAPLPCLVTRHQRPGALCLDTVH